MLVLRVICKYIGYKIINEFIKEYMYDIYLFIYCLVNC